MAGEKRILIVDDQPLLRLLVRETLDDGSGAYSIREACTGREAIAAVDAFQPQVVVLDVMLPDGRDGYQVCEYIKAHPRLGPASRVILLTARGQKADMARGVQAKADHYLVKPFSPEALIHLVAQAFRNITETASQ